MVDIIFYFTLYMIFTQKINSSKKISLSKLGNFSVDFSESICHIFYDKWQRLFSQKAPKTNSPTHTEKVSPARPLNNPGRGDKRKNVLEDLEGIENEWIAFSFVRIDGYVRRGRANKGSRIRERRILCTGEVGRKIE